MDCIYWTLLIVLVVAGSFGGVLDFCNRFTISRDTSNGRSQVLSSPNKPNTVGLFYRGAELQGNHLLFLASFHIMLGIGGALAMALALISIGQFKFEVTTDNLLLVTTLSVVAGFGGNRILEKVRGQLERQLEDTQREVTALKSSVSTMKEEIALDIEVTDCLNNAHSVLEGKEEKPWNEIEEVVRTLKHLMAHQQLSRLVLRRAAIYLGRIYRTKFVDLERATAHLSDFVKVYGNKEDTHLAAVLFNRACYNTLIAKTKNGSQKDELLESAHKDLERACKIDEDVQTQIFGDEKTEPDSDLGSYREWLAAKGS
mgnify:CR=1 FL=1